MLVCSVELWPGGDAARAEHLGAVLIANDGMGASPAFGNYRCALTHSGKYRHRPGIWRSGNVTGHRRCLSPYHLIHKAIEACVASGAKDQPKWAIRLAAIHGKQRISQQREPRAVDVMLRWLAGEEANLKPEALVEQSPFDPPPAPPTPPTPLESVLSEVERLLDVTAKPEPKYKIDACEYWRVIGETIRALRKAYAEYAKETA